PRDRAEAVEARERDVLLDGQRLHEPLALSVLRDEEEAVRDPPADRLAVDTGSVHPHPTDCLGPLADQRLQELGAAGPHQAVDADDLAGPHGQRDAVEPEPAAGPR